SGVLIPAKPGGNKKKKKTSSSEPNSELSALNLGRGVETMYRTTYRTHTNLSSIADNKANIMLSINAIIISIVVSTLVTSFDTNPKLVVPTIILLTVCLTSVVFATLSTRPKVTEGKFTREDIEQKRSNLLFFGNYYNMELEDFHWGMMEMIRNSDFLYSSMTRDLYFLGKVLSKKYRYLSICYSIFMYGLIGSVIAFAIAFLAPGV
ncbi:MAG: Pycsar system effector family protein, partial [Bacteroidota bacterium]